MFPLGEMVKTNVKEIDFSKGFHERNQKESQDFYGGHYTDLLNVEPKEGLIVDTEGKVLGKHMGMWNYTIGQRKGLGVSAPRPLYVIALDPVNNKVIVGYEEHTGNTKVYASSIVWGALESLEKPLHVQGKIRSTGYPMPCTLSLALVEGKEMVCATFDSPVKAATCGQSLVAYDGDKVLCGGIIEKVQ